LDRNGLRPSRYYVTKDDLVIMGSEVGVLDVAPENVLLKGRLQPGRMFLVDLDQGRIVADDELKQRIATQQPYADWLRENTIALEDLPPGQPSRSGVHKMPKMPRPQFGSPAKPLDASTLL